MVSIGLGVFLIVTMLSSAKMLSAQFEPDTKEGESNLFLIDVQPDQIVAKNEPIGLTGNTGMAGGDHLHFGMLVHDTFVNPVEWWDASWIKNNITSKIKDIQSVMP